MSIKVTLGEQWLAGPDGRPGQPQFAGGKP